MIILLVLYLAGVAVELGLHIPGLFWRFRKILAVVALSLIAFSSGALVVLSFNLCSVLIGLLGLYRIFNLLRIMEARMHERYLWRATLRTSAVLIGLQVGVALLWLGWDAWHQTGHMVWGVVAGLQLAVALISLWSVLRNIRHSAWPRRAVHYSDNELPTVSVAIPARNETDDLQACLHSVLASDYPKLEVLVLDDCSQDKRTPEIIRQFAHGGVRFVKGEEPINTWLPKNQAYDHLVREASGEYILFCGVDVRFAPDSLRQLVSTMLYRKKQMISVLPRRTVAAEAHTSIIQAMRYWWELVPPRRLFNRPPVLSSCWIIQRKALHAVGGFRAVARSIVPEAHFAKAVAVTADGYSFWRSGKSERIESVKTAADQRNTAIRMRYPQVHRRPEQVALHSMAELLFLLLPFTLAVGGFWLPIGWPAQVLAVLTCVCLVAIHELVVISARVNSWWFGLIAPPFMIATDIVFLHYSMWRYEFSSVDWKGRNICIPAMHVIPHLPKLGK